MVARRQFSASEKLTMLRLHFLDKTPALAICSQYNLNPGVFYRWRKELFNPGTHVFEWRLPAHATGHAKPSRHKDAKMKAQRDETHRIWMLAVLHGRMQKKDISRELSGTLEEQEVCLLLDCATKRPLCYRNRAVFLLSYLKGIPVRTIALFLSKPRSTLYNWTSIYRRRGCDVLLVPRRSANRKSQNKALVDVVFSIIHCPPTSYGINRTNWRQKDIQDVLRKQGLLIGRSCIAKIIKDAGYHYRKAKRVLTSTDPDYRSKLQQITEILANLGPKEKFFSIDEFGPFAVKMQGGRTLVKRGHTTTVPQYQKSKGSLIITAALELATNQVTHFYSGAKNTQEMIRLVHVLLRKYRNEETIYLSWDAGSWHVSKVLYDHVEKINMTKRSGPHVKLVPLPASAQFLNVIESVFSGMARAIIHNSDYASVDKCMEAVDLHFAERNRYFRRHPKRAGDKIWGKERVVPQFRESNNCKDPRYQGR